MFKINAHPELVCPANGEPCGSQDFCARRKNSLEAYDVHDDVIGGIRVNDLDCGVAAAVTGEFCVQNLMDRLSSLAVDGAGIAATQRQAEALVEVIGHTRRGSYW